MLRNMILIWSRPVIAQSAADDLFNLTIVQVDTWAEASHERERRVG